MYAVSRPTNRTPLAQILATTTGTWPVPQRHDRAAWEAQRTRPVGQEIISRATALLDTPTPQLSATRYLAYTRHGLREPHEQPVDARRERLMLFALAECLEATDRFADAVLDEAWAICEESTWVTAAHGFDWQRGLPENRPIIDLWSANTSFMLAELDYMLGDALHPVLRDRIRAEIDARSTTPFLARNDFPWLGYGKKKINNWMPVCAGGTAAAAIYLEPDIDRLAAVLEKALDGINRYLATFGADGGCPEGVGYWEKGIFSVVAFAELLAHRTGGAVDLFENPHLRRIARFPARVELSPGWYVPFSDTGIDRRPQAALLHLLANRYALPELAALDHADPATRTLTNRGPVEKTRDLFWYPVTDDGRRTTDDGQRTSDQAMPFANHQAHGATPSSVVGGPWSAAATAPTPSPVVGGPWSAAATANRADFLTDVQWLIARATPDSPQGLVLAAKGGHNAEPHNQNDIGSFVVHWRGESLLADLGAMRYTSATFHPNTRYTLLANRSLGHSVPLVNGYEQLAGTTHCTTQARYTLGPTTDTLALEMAAAYPHVADLAQLDRTLTLDRSVLPGTVTVSDTAHFASQPGTLASVLITLGTVQIVEPGTLLVVGAHSKLLVRYDATQLALEIETLPQIDLRGGPRDVTRIRLTSTPAPIVSVQVVITPLA